MPIKKHFHQIQLITHTFESSDEDMVTPFQAKKWKILSDSEDDIGDGENRSDEKELFPLSMVGNHL